MATVLLCEPHVDVRSLLALVVRRLGHTPVEWTGSFNGEVSAADAVVLEPGQAEGLILARWLRENAPHLPLICTSIFPRGREIAELEPEEYLLKPFPLYELEAAIARVLEPSRLAAASA